MRLRKEKKCMVRKGQTAIEYMLLLTICALIVFAGFRTFFQPGERARNGFDLYFNKVSNSIMGPAPVLP
jgi:Flp pilus assembly pilin Flp